MYNHFGELPKLLIGKGILQRLLCDMKTFNDKKILMIAEATNGKHNLLKTIKSSIATISKSIHLHFVNDVRKKLTCSHNFPTTLIANQYEVIIGVGDNDLLNYTKIISLFSKQADDYSALRSSVMTKPKRHLMLLPTTVTCGLEVTNKTFTYDKVFPVIKTNESMLPSTIIYDPLISVHASLTNRVNASIITFAQAFERYFFAEKLNKFCLATLKLLFTYIVRATYNKRDIEAQEGLLKAGMLFGLANVITREKLLINCFTIPLIRRTKCSYPVAIATMLPYVVQLYRDVNNKRGKQLADTLQLSKGRANNFYRYITFRLMNICKALGFPTNLRTLGISQNELPNLASEAFQLWEKNNGKHPHWNEFQFMSLYLNAYNGIISDSLD